MNQQIRIDLVHSADGRLRVSLGMIVSAGEGLRQRFDIDRATGYRGDLSSAVQQVLRSEIGAGILLGLKRAAHRNWHFELVRLRAEQDGEDALLEVPSDGFAVAACLIAAHASGVEDLAAKPHGGYDWRWGGMDVQAF